MEFSDYLSIAAILISIAGFALSFFVVFRDRPRLKVTSKYLDACEYGAAKIQVVLTNRGRRPVIVRLLGGHDSNREYGGKFFKPDEGGLRLGEDERHELYIERDDTVLFAPDDDVVYDEMWVEDSLGNRHAIPNSKAYIAKLRD